MNISEVQTVFERATPEVDKTNLKVAFLIGAFILIGTIIIIIDYRKKEKESVFFHPTN